MLLDKKMATKCKYEWEKELLSDEEVRDKWIGAWEEQKLEHIDLGELKDDIYEDMFALKAVAQAQIDKLKTQGYMSKAEINQWLEEVQASGKVKCPECEWSQFTAGENVGMPFCDHCNCTGFVIEPLRME